MKQVILMAAVLSVAFAAQAAVDQRTSAFVLYKNKKDVRTIRVLNDSKRAENCTVSYTKGGVEEVVGSNRSMTACKSILKGVQANLESSNYSCRNVQSANVLSSPEVINQ